MGDEFITIARALKPQGRHGEIAAELFTNFPERFAERSRMYALQADGGRRELRLEEYWFTPKGRPVLKFAGVDSIEDAEALAGCELQIPREERVELEAGSAYVSELMGCTVIAGGPAVGGGARELGQVADVVFGAGEAPLLLVREEQHEYMIPLAEAYLKHLDVAARRIEMELPEGMLDLDAPLTREEKQRQQERSS